MRNYRCLHETIIKDVLDLADYIAKSDADDILDKTKRKPYASTSIARIASDMTLVFPVLCSANLTIDTAMMISKAIERKAVVMLQILFSSMQVQDAETAQEVISKFHSNIKLSNKMTVDDFISIADRFEEGVTVNKTTLKALSEDFKQNAFFVMNEDTSDKSLSDIYKVNNRRIYNEAKPGNSRDFGNNSNTFKDVKDINDSFSKQLLSSDIKKANELVPTTMVVNFTYLNSEGRAIPIKDVVIGVKARLIPVSSDDIITHILTKLDDRNYITQLIRATTREISFVKDFLLAIDKAKIEALSNSKQGSSNPMWKVLERRAYKSRIKRFVGRSNDANAITTLVVSQEEVEYVKKNYNVNFESIKTMNTILDAYNLMGFVIVDETLEVAKFHFDTGEDLWETLSFTSLEKESNDNSYKKIVNLMSKISR